MYPILRAGFLRRTGTPLKFWRMELLRRTGNQRRARKGLARGTFPRLVWKTLRKETKREMGATSLLARGLERLHARSVEARHWSQYAVRQNRTLSSSVKFTAATVSCEQAHKVIMDCTSQQFAHVPHRGTSLLERASSWLMRGLASEAMPKQLKTLLR